MKRLVAVLVLSTALLLAGAPAFADGTTTASNSGGSTTTTTVSTVHGDDGDTVTTVDSTVYPCHGGKQWMVTNTTISGPSEGSEESTASSVHCGTPVLHAPGFAVSATAYAYGVSGSEVEFSVLGDSTPTGTVQVVLDGKAFTTVTLDASGSGVTALPRTLAAGHHSVDLAYAGDDSNAPGRLSEGTGPMSSGPLSVDVSKARTSTSVTLPKRVSKKKHATALVHVRSLESGTRPTGTVRVYDGRKRVATVALRASAKGDLSVRLPRLKKGPRSIHVVYTADKNSLGSKSAVKKIKVKK